MSPRHDLTALARAKRLLRGRIAHRRAQSAAVVAAAARPLAWLDEALQLWRRIHPIFKYAAVPLGLWLTRAVAPRTGVLGSLLRWGPPVLGLVRSLAGLGRSPRA